MKLFHWMIGGYNLLVMAGDEETARKVLTDHVEYRGLKELVDPLKEQPLFIAEKDYPIVIWR